MATETALVRLEACTAVQIFESGFIDPVLDQIEAEARSEAARLDISTEANRRALASLAYKVARSKTFIDNQRKALVADEKKRLQRIDKEGGRIWDRLERLQTEVRKPLTEWEEADRLRISEHESALGDIEIAGRLSGQNWQAFTVSELRGSLAAVEENKRDWEEFGARAAGVRAVAKAQILEAIGKREKQDADHAELARLRAESAERERADREARVAQEAREKAERAAAVERERIEREKRQAERRAADAEERRIAEQRESSRRAKEAAERAERDKQAAVKAERERAKANAERERVEQGRREASARIRKRVLGEISQAILALDVPEENAEAIALALAIGKIPHVSVVF